MDFTFKTTKQNKVYNILKDNGVSEQIINRLRRNKNLCLVNGEPSRVVDVAPANSLIVIKVYDNPTSNKLKKTYNKIDVLFEDEYILAVNKPPFLTSIPNRYKTSIAGDILGYTGLDTYMPINRLDYKTSGILLLAKNPLIHHLMNGKFKKTYTAILAGTLPEKNYIIKSKIELSALSPSLRQSGGETGKESTTIIKTKKIYKNGYSLCEIELLTGRTHQIRVHTSSAGAPVLGDDDYGSPATTLINRQALHASVVKFVHPITHKNITITAPLPQDIENVIKQLEKL